MSPRSRLAVALVSTLLVGYVLLGNLLGRVLGDTTYGQLSVFNEVVRFVIDAYVDPVNLDRLMAGARVGLTDALDAESTYLEPEDWKAYQQPAKEGDADIGIVMTRRYGYLAVVAPRPGSPAERAGVKSGDYVKTIDGRHTRGVSLPIGERILVGAPGSVVKLELLRPGVDPIDVQVVRERLEPQPAKGRVLAEGPGYLKVAEVGPRTADEVRDELVALRRGGAPSLVLDLRDAAFGVPAEGVGLAAVFMQGGVVTKVVGRRIEEESLSADPKKTAWELPLAVLVDAGTAGPAEIVAAAMKDAGHAVIGQRTSGHAPIQRLIPLSEGGLVLTIARYVSPKGDVIHGRGVEPTVPVSPDVDDDDATQAPARDLALEKAIEVLAGELKKAA
ncbi:MAG TPA: S41 family peptidase [Vicinamibacteria bacterium]|nr:S41 family peptidase [Vicinamibacteria bacterium]